MGQDNSLARLPIKIISVKIQLLGSQMSQLSGEWSGRASWMNVRDDGIIVTGQWTAIKP